MRRKKGVENVFPSEYEEYSEELWYPTHHEEEIQNANRVLRDFVSEMEANRVPKATLDDIKAATDTLGIYAGYPADAAYMEEFFSLRMAASYRTTASVVKRFSADMNQLIEARRAESARLAAASKAGPRRRTITDDDVPF